jgi:hypothetical protein
LEPTDARQDGHEREKHRCSHLIRDRLVIEVILERRRKPVDGMMVVGRRNAVRALRQNIVRVIRGQIGSAIVK